MSRFPAALFSKKALYALAGVAVALLGAAGFAKAHADQNSASPPPVHSMQPVTLHRVANGFSSTVAAPTGAQAAALQKAKDATAAQGQRGTPFGPFAQNGVGPTGTQATINGATRLGPH